MHNETGGAEYCTSSQCLIQESSTCNPWEGQGQLEDSVKKGNRREGGEGG